MARGRPPIDFPPTTAETRKLLNQLRAHREDVVAKKRLREDERDRDRKIRIAARLVRFVRRGDSEARKLLDRIFDGLRAGDRPLFVRWDLYPPSPGPVPVSDRHLPRTLQEIDAEIQRLEAHLEKRLEEDREEDEHQHAHRMTIIGGALLGLVASGDAEADAMLKTILPKIPKKERGPFEGWTPPTLPAPAAQAAQQETPRRNNGPGRSSSSAPSPDAHGKDEPAGPASNVAQTSTTNAAGGDETAARQRGGEGATPAAASRQQRERTGDGSTRSRSPRGDEKDPDNG